MIISVQSKKRGKEGTKTQASDWPTDSGADIVNREVFKETKLITKNVTSWLAQYTTICIHVSNLLKYPSFKTGKIERRKKFSFYISIPCNAFFLCSGHATVLASSAKMFPMHYNAIILGLEQTTTYMVYLLQSLVPPWILHFHKQARMSICKHFILVFFKIKK